VTAKHLVVGFDGADLGVVRSLGPARLPNLFAAMARGAFAALRSVEPPATLPNWLTFLTAVDPAVHGVFDFTRRTGYRVDFTGGTIRQAPLVAEALDAAGLETAWLSFPGTWPPPRLARGVFVSGWDSPVAFEANPSFVEPPSLYDDLVRRFGSLVFGDVDEFQADAPGFHDALPAHLVARAEKKTDVATWLLDQRAWDVFAVYFGESDTAAHHLWPLHDLASPRTPEARRRAPHADPGTGTSPLAHVYMALDASLGALLRAAGPDTELTVVSDHGSGGSSDKVLYLNRALAEAGLLTFRRTALRTRAVRALKHVALRHLPAGAREALFRFRGTELPSRLESSARFGAIDFARTRAFSEELNYFPGVHLNLRGREPEGTVAPEDRAQVMREVEAALLALRDPWSGAPVVRSVTPREELFRGPHLERAPDLLLELHLDDARPVSTSAGETGAAATGDGYSWNLMPSTDPKARGRVFRRLRPEEYLGRKGRSLPGAHRSHGLFVAAGPSVRAAGEIEATMHDAAVTTLARIGLGPPTEARGRVLWEALAEGTPTASALPVPALATQDPAARAPSSTRDVERRLRALGYIE